MPCRQVPPEFEGAQKRVLQAEKHKHKHPCGNRLGGARKAPKVTGVDLSEGMKLECFHLYNVLPYRFGRLCVKQKYNRHYVRLPTTAVGSRSALWWLARGCWRACCASVLHQTNRWHGPCRHGMTGVNPVFLGSFNGLHHQFRN